MADSNKLPEYVVNISILSLVIAGYVLRAIGGLSGFAGAFLALGPISGILIFRWAMIRPTRSGYENE